MQKQKPKKIVIIGGGAAGYFLASNLPKSNNYYVTLLEKAKSPLQKVKISGGGRCNVTHACFIPNDLVENYPRGNKELHSVFAQFQPADTFQWFQEKNLELKVEEDQRVFPVTDNSESIIAIFKEEARKNNIDIQLSQGVKKIKMEGNTFQIFTQDKEYEADMVIAATGSSKQMWKLFEGFNHTLIPSVPSLFTFNIKDTLLKDLMGTSFSAAEVSIPSLKKSEFGPLLITHWGLSGPAVLKLSAFCAVELAAQNYRFTINVNFINRTTETCFNDLLEAKKSNPKKKWNNHKLYDAITRNFWKKIIAVSNIKEEQNIADCTHLQLQTLAKNLTQYQFIVNGKSTYKDEFVTAGGIDLKEINFKTMESKLHKNLYFAGEILNIDAITGGFNFQACWSEAYIIAQEIKKQLN